MGVRSKAYREERFEVLSERLQLASDVIHRWEPWHAEEAASELRRLASGSVELAEALEGYAAAERGDV